MWESCQWLGVNPSNAEATFVQSSRTQIFLKNIESLSCWYSLDSSHWVLSDEYPFARVSVIIQVFLHNFVLAKLAISSIRVKHCFSLGTQVSSTTNNWLVITLPRYGRKNMKLKQLYCHYYLYFAVLKTREKIETQTYRFRAKDTSYIHLKTKAFSFRIPGRRI